MYWSVLRFKSNYGVCCISSAQISDKEIRDIKPCYYIEMHMNFAISVLGMSTFDTVAYQ